MRTFLFALIALAALTPPALAQSRECGQEIKSYAKREVQKVFSQLRVLGWNNLVGIREAEVLAGFQKIQKVWVFSAGFATTTGSRQFAVWTAIPNGPTAIQINCRAWKALRKEDAPYLMTHEVLGVLGYNDDAYSYTAWAKFVIENKIRPGEVQLARLEADSGGSSVVGGGGDPRDFRIKHDALRLLVATARENGVSAVKLDRQIKKLLELRLRIEDGEISKYPYGWEVETYYGDPPSYEARRVKTLVVHSSYLNDERNYQAFLRECLTQASKRK